MGDHDGDQIHTTEMPPSTTSRFSDARDLPLASQHPALCGGHPTIARVPQTLLVAPMHVPTSWERKWKLLMARGKLSRQYHSTLYLMFIMAYFVNIL